MLRDHKKVVLGVFFLIVITTVCAYIYSLYYPYISTRLLWRDIQFEDVKVDENLSFSMENFTQVRKNDPILRLAIYAQINKEDPLFGGPGFDINTFEQAVSELEKHQNDFKNDLGLTDNIYPIDFLKKITEINKLNDTFKDNKTLENAHKLLKAEREAVETYRDYAISLKGKLTKTKLPTGLFIQAGGSTSKDILLGDLQKTINNAAYLRSEISSRSRCLSISTYFCRREKLKVFTDNLEIASVVPDEIYPALDVISSEPVIANGPYQIVTPCFRESVAAPNIRLLYLLETHKAKDLVPQLADNTYFEKLSVEQFGEELYNQYQEHEIDWIVSTMNNGYTCNNMEYQPSIATLNLYYKQYGQKPLFSNATDLKHNNLNEVVEKTRQLEHAFASEKYPSEITMNKLAKNYADIYNQLVELHDQSELRENLLERFQFINNRLADFGRTLSHISYRTASHARMTAVNPKGQIELNYVYFMRNNYGLTLGGFSPSIWRNKEKLSYLDENTVISPDLVGYVDFVKQFSVEYAKKVISVPRDVVVNELRKKAGL